MIRPIVGPMDRIAPLRTIREPCLSCAACQAPHERPVLFSKSFRRESFGLESLRAVASRVLSFLNATFRQNFRLVFLNSRTREIDTSRAPGVRVSSSIWRLMETNLLGFVMPQRPDIIFIIEDNLAEAALRKDDPNRYIANTVRHEFAHALTLLHNPEVQEFQSELVASWFER